LVSGRGLALAPGVALGPLPWQTAYMCPPRFVRAVQRLIQTQPFDVVHVQLARMAPVLPRARTIPAVIDLIDALSLNMRRRAARERAPQRWLIAWEARKMARYEQQLIAQTEQLVLTSPQDWEALGRPANVHVIPNGVDLERFPFRLTGRDPATVVFTGRMGYFPNADAAVFFATQVFPRVRQAIPQARFLIVGADPPARVRRLARLPGVEVTGYVPRIQDYLQRATVAVAPLRAGSGIQNKVLEAMASGVPVVATSYALGGLRAEPGVHAVRADTAPALAEAVIALLQDPARRQKLAQAARILVETHYTWEGAARQLEEVYQQAQARFRLR